MTITVIIEKGNFATVSRYGYNRGKLIDKRNGSCLGKQASLATALEAVADNLIANKLGGLL